MIQVVKITGDKYNNIKTNQLWLLSQEFNLSRVFSRCHCWVRLWLDCTLYTVQVLVNMNYMALFKEKYIIIQ